MHAGRRLFIGGAVAFTALLSLPRVLLAVAWPKKAFGATVAKESLLELLGTNQTTPSEDIRLDVPVIAANGAEVPVLIETALTGVESISIIVENNPRPLAISFEFSPQTLTELVCRIKMAETSSVMAVVVTDSGIFSTAKEVTVIVGGCA